MSCKPLAESLITLTALTTELEMFSMCCANTPKFSLSLLSWSVKSCFSFIAICAILWGMIWRAGYSMSIPSSKSVAEGSCKLSRQRSKSKFVSPCLACWRKSRITANSRAEIYIISR